MPQLLESTRNYLKSSTKLGRRLSSYRDDSSASEASLHDVAPATVEVLRQHRPSPQNRLSSFFSLEGRNRNSISSEDRTTINVLSRKIGPEAEDQQQQQQQQDAKKKRRNSSRRRSTQIQHNLSTVTSLPPSQHRPSFSMVQDQVPRGRSPAMSVSPTVRTVASASSSYDGQPQDFPSIGHYQAHVWRRTLLEESIMHSLKLGYGERAQGDSRPSSRRRSRSRSLKRSTTGRSRKSREQQAAILAAAMNTDLPPSPSGNTNETAIDRSISVNSNGNSAAVLKAQQDKKSVPNNSPYQMLLNPSTSNITHSFASFTLELPEHQVTHVMSSSVVPNLFKIKMGASGSSQSRSRTRRGSTASRIINTASGPSPRVLTGKTVAESESKENMDPRLTVVAAV